VGQQESEARTVNIRTRDNEVKGAVSIDEAVNMFKQLVAEYK
jgi:threonyl-tRNA synthetase